MAELKKYYKSPEFIEAGLDEAGRGPLIGRVYAAAVIIDPGAELHPLLNDSKKMTRKRRGIVREWIEENCVFEVAYSDEKEVDELNILHATQKAMHKAIDNLVLEPEYLIVDGNFFRKYISKSGDHVNHVTIEKGDAKYASISAASVLAKEYHDDYIEELVEENPELDEKYGLLSNMGYGTQKHMDGIKEHGVSKFHRKSFKCCC
jgi:ribonuclease HII|tara:strand:+ start:391 stop:1005 length:615 start_codon:yes stop_codon:yes gene_type:complete